MRYSPALTLVIIAMLAGPAVADSPAAMRGLWAATANDCEAILSGRRNVEPAPEWVRVTATTVEGTSAGRILRTIGRSQFEATGSGVAGVPNVFELRANGILAQTIGDARGASLYLRCATP